MHASHPLECDYTRLGHKIQVRRKELGITQEQLAEKINCSLTHLSRIESGARPSLGALLRLSTFLGYSQDDLTGLYPDRNPYVQELSDLILNHPTEEQRMAVSVLRHFFLLLEQFKAYQKNKDKNETPDPSQYSADESLKASEDICLEAWN